MVHLLPLNEGFPVTPPPPSQSPAAAPQKSQVDPSIVAVLPPIFLHRAMMSSARIVSRGRASPPALPRPGMSEGGTRSRLKVVSVNFEGRFGGLHRYSAYDGIR